MLDWNRILIFSCDRELILRSGQVAELMAGCHLRQAGFLFSVNKKQQQKSVASSSGLCFPGAGRRTFLVEVSQNTTPTWHPRPMSQSVGRFFCFSSGVVVIVYRFGPRANVGGWTNLAGWTAASTVCVMVFQLDVQHRFTLAGWTAE